MEFINISNNGEKEIVGLNNELKAIYCAKTFSSINKNLLFVTNTLYEANQIYLYLLNHTSNVLLFPMDDFLTSEALAISPELKTKRLETLIEIVNNNKNIVVTNLMGYLRFLPSSDNFKKSMIRLDKETSISPKSLAEFLINIGYTRETMVNKTGEFAIRGYVVDIYPIGIDNPVRIEFFDDEIESMRFFDVNTQLSVKSIENISVYPNTEDLVSNKCLDHHYELNNYNGTNNISNFIEAEITFFNDFNSINVGYKDTVTDIFEYNKDNKQSIKYMYEMDEIKNKKVINFSTFDTAANNEPGFSIKEINEQFLDKFSINKKFNDYIKTKKTVVVCLDNKYKAINLQEELDNKNIVMTNENEIFENKINLIVKKIYDSFEYNNYVVISNSKLFNKHDKVSNYKSNFRIGTKIKNINKLNVGDYVVHSMNGVGRYLGLATLEKNGLKKDYLQIEYKDGDKLYVPVEKIEFITKYSSGEGMIPRLNKLNGTDWQKTKLKVKKRIENIAADLLKLYAARENSVGFAFLEDDKNQVDFEKEFKFEETSDQLKVIDEIKKDMEKPIPMDRLLCGDVGYGKTEVAFRAIFKAILSGKQVAFLCPTTILSNQHYQNALNRFKSFPINIALLNRFVSTKKANQIYKDLETGKIDLVFGTHKLLNSNIKYKDLGLLIIDEEQRFGVKHKEKIKQIKNDIDVLTLSATPIPRTLQMSMSGVKSLSLIETPPMNRYPVQTYVLGESNQIIKDAIYKEMSREGQVFLLYNNVNNMEEKVLQIKKLVPEARIVFAHGQMDKNELENIMLSFINKEYDVLICTTIIETGIDMPNVNTLIVIDADRFGLSQLYQLRGRVGRSNKIAYCYLMYNNKKILTEVAEKRLKAIKEFTELGSGFSIAMRDLSIRGAGDILGSEQAGYVDAVGIDMFLKLLDEEINRQKGNLAEVTDAEVKDKPLIDVATSISNEYVEEDELKIYVHQKINEINTKNDLLKVKEELIDRFGKLDDDIIIYMHEELFEKTANRLKIKNIKQTKNFVEVWIPDSIVKSIKVDDLFVRVVKLSRMFRFSMRLNQLVITLDTVKLDRHFIYYLIDLLEIIESLKNN